MSRSSSLLSTHVHVIFVHLPVNMFVAATQHAFQHPCLRVYDFVGLFTTSSPLDHARVSCASLQHSCPIYKRATTPRVEETAGRNRGGKSG